MAGHPIWKRVKRKFMGNEHPESTMPLPAEVLAKLASLSGYDLMLEMDAASRNHGAGLAEIESELAAYKAGAVAQTSQPVVDDFAPVAYKEAVDLESAQPLNRGPQYIDNPDQYRMKYNPSQKGVDNQSKVRQAIICPACSSPLGIPDVRPIKVTCPQCMHEAVFHS
tara:strand:+ start:434 stop:934 length:501 start_codon:yes stop_codon:yes gene_type:complete